MPILPEHEKYHTMDAKDAHIKEKIIMHVTRNTTQTGEQFHAEIPVYPEDTRQMVKDRTNFMLSIIQDRLEDENKAVNEQTQKQQRINDLAQAYKRNHISFQAKAKALMKNVARKKMTLEEHDKELAQMKTNLELANKELEASISELTDGHKAITERAEESARSVD